MLSDFDGLSGNVGTDAGLDSGGGAIDGSIGDCGTEEAIPVLVARTEGHPHALVIQPDRIYWTVHEHPLEDGSLGSALYSADRTCCGSSCARLLALFGSRRLSDLTADLDGLYVAEQYDDGDSRVLRVDTESGDLQALASKQTRPFGIAVDNTYVYWTDELQGALRLTLKRPVDGGPGAPTNLAEPIPNPGFLRRDPHSDRLYWGSRADGRLFRCRLSLVGGQPRCEPEVLADPSTAVEGPSWGLVVDDDSVFWRVGDVQGEVRKVDKLANAPASSIVLASGDDASGARWLDVDDSHVYWTNHLRGQILRTGKGGDVGAPEVWASVDGAHTCAVDADAVYVASWANGEVYRIPK